ncbi:hypothetical protein NQ318_014892 [Aromia moschata]|uniref:Uncharacterized protein n=1 Tax=Aromia moschata TaxID=1265417 RepID=A0AAV8YV18_9CUCU|nr:hypothetical protein NQ318_014892 [Aromia moschata]
MHRKAFRGKGKFLTANEEDALSIAESEQSKDEVEVEILDESDEDNAREEPDNKANTAQETEKPNEAKGDDDIRESSSDSEDSEPKFPDTHIKIQHFGGTNINLITEPSGEFKEAKNEENVFYLGDDRPVILKETQGNARNRSRGNSESKNKPPSTQKEIKEDVKQQQSKRGQKSKLKKIKEKI